MNAPHQGLSFAAALLFCLLAGCGGSQDLEESVTTDQEEVTPLSREQIQERAEAMSPAVAESLGIVDSTIHIEQPVPPESLQLPEFPPDSAPAQ